MTGATTRRKTIRATCGAIVGFAGANLLIFLEILPSSHGWLALGIGSFLGGLQAIAIEANELFGIADDSLDRIHYVSALLCAVSVAVLWNAV